MIDRSLRSRLARAVVTYVEGSPDHPFARIVDARHDDGRDVVDLELEIAVSQDRRVAIRALEPVRLVFTQADDSIAPRILATRGDFPIGEVHTNLDREADGLNLCVWEENWEDLSSTLTGQALIERLRWWFAGMADGSLHKDDQGLEPLIPATAHTIVFPPGSLIGDWAIGEASEHNGRVTLMMTKDRPSSARVKFDVFYHVLPTQVHRAMTARPYDLGGLVRLVGDLDFDLLGALKAWLLDGSRLTNASDHRALFILPVPLRRTTDAPEEAYEAWVYTPSETLAELGEKLGFTITTPVHGRATTTPVMGSPGGTVDLDSIRMFGWRLVQRLDRLAARRFSGAVDAPDRRLVAIGAGAIGSNVVMNSAHAGLGTWTIIDDDVLLPHNTVRQSQADYGIGHPKAGVLAGEANAVLAESGNEAIVADVLQPGDDAERISAAFRSADMVVDFSASPSVVGHLGDHELERAASFFFSPDGADLVVLDEGPGRIARLDEVEAQYFLATAAHSRMEGHLAAARTDRIRYANACQDLSRPLPPWQVQTLSGLAAGQFGRLFASDRPSISVWRLEPGSGGVMPVRIAVSRPSRFEGPFRVTISDSVVAMIRSLRGDALPHETGGILLGCYDLSRGVLHIVAALAAPPDSDQAPTYFVRGTTSLQPQVRQLSEATAGRLHYVGEWHSHPDGAAARPSADDEKVFEHLREHLDPVGTPYVMLICGRDETWFRAGWQERGRLEGAVGHAERPAST